jgi:hypothetical protein
VLKRLVVGWGLALSLAPSVAGAQTFAFSGVSSGCFGVACAPSSAASIGNLGFTAGSFDVLAPAIVGAQASIGNSPSSSNNLGAFSLGAGNFNYAGTPFRLAVTFTLPTGTTLAAQSFNATLTGFVVKNAGGVTFDFNNSPLSFSFPQGTFTLRVNDVDVSVAGANVPVTGRILITAVPGPVAGAGLLPLIGIGAVWLARRRRQSAV